MTVNFEENQYIDGFVPRWKSTTSWAEDSELDVRLFGSVQDWRDWLASDEGNPRAIRPDDWVEPTTDEGLPLSSSSDADPARPIYTVVNTENRHYTGTARDWSSLIRIAPDADPIHGTVPAEDAPATPVE